MQPYRGLFKAEPDQHLHHRMGHHIVERPRVFHPAQAAAFAAIQLTAAKSCRTAASSIFERLKKMFMSINGKPRHFCWRDCLLLVQCLLGISGVERMADMHFQELAARIDRECGQRA